MPEKSMRKTEVLVIGAGPAGASAAEKSSRSGFRTLIVDRKQRAGEPVQCAEFIPAYLGGYANHTAVDSRKIFNMCTHLEDGDSSSVDSPGFVIDRAEFDRELVKKAENAGSEFLPGFRLVSLDMNRNQAEFTGQGRKMRVQYQVLVAADGPVSTVARLLGFRSLRTLVTRQYTVPLLSDLNDLQIWLSTSYPGGYAWLFPKRSTANLGIGIEKAQHSNTRQCLDELHVQLVREGIVGENVLNQTGGLIPVEGLRSSLQVKNILFAGDAAGLCHPITGAGIYPAVTSGEMAGDAVTLFLKGQVSSFLEYEEEVRAIFNPALKRALLRREQQVKTWEACQSDPKLLRQGWVSFPEYFLPADAEAMI